jgi:hypothetical protein
MAQFISHDAIDDAEGVFPFSDLLEYQYFKKYKKAYYRMVELGYQLGFRNYFNLLKYIAEISEYNKQHARGFAKSLRSSQADWNNCEAIFSEIIVYRYYTRLIYEGLIKAIDRNAKECDLIIHRLDDSLAYLEVFCVKPNLKTACKPGEIIVQDIKTHTQGELASVRQKLLRKIEKQRQFTKHRDNYAVIELNDISIAGDFSILSSLSSGYKIRIGAKTMEKVAEDYDWSASIFDDDSTRFLRGILYFSLGDYASRKFIYNPKS